MFKCFLKRWNVIFFVLPLSVAISNKHVIKQFLILHTVLPLHLTSFDSAPLTLSCPLSFLSPPHCGNVIQVWCTDCAWVRFKCSPNSNQILPSHYLLLHFAEYRVAAKFSQQIYIITGKAVWDEKEIQLGGTTGDRRDQSWSPLTPITAGRVGGGCCHSNSLNEIPSCCGYLLCMDWPAEEANGRCATVTCIGRAIFLVVRWPSGQMTLATVTLEPSYGSQVTQHPHRLTLFVKSQHWGQLPISSIGMLDHHQSSMAALTRTPGAWMRHT